MVSRVPVAFLLVTAIAPFALGSSTQAPSTAVEDQACFFAEITGTIGGRVFDENGHITSFTVTVRGQSTPIKVMPPNAGATAAINEFNGQNAKVTSHNTGNPPQHIYDSIGDP